MANRNLNVDRQVTGNVLENPDQLPAMALEMSEKILRQGEESKITEGLSQAQLDLSALQSQYRIDNQLNPEQGSRKYKEDRQRIYDGIGKNISPLYQRQWRENLGKLNSRDDLSQQAWGIQQTRVNTVNSLNTSMSNNFKQASLDGQSFGESEEGQLEAILNFDTSAQSLEGYGNKNLGEATTGQMMETYKEDYIKSFVSGVSDTNPAKAAALLDNETIKNSFDDPAEWKKMKGFIDNRALNFQQIAIQEEALEAVKSSASIITSNKPLSQLEVMEMSEGASKPTQDYLLRKAGFKTSSDALSPSQKAANKVAIFEKINLLPNKEGITGEDLEVISNELATNLNDKSINQSDYEYLTNQMLIPYVNQVEENLSNFEVDKNSVSNWFGVEDIGFAQFQKDTAKFLFEDNPVKDEDTTLNEEDFLFNNLQKIKLHDAYSSALSVEAEKNGIPVAEIMRLPNVIKRNKILNDAAVSAKTSYIQDRFPTTKNMADNMPSKIVDGGKEISTGLGNGSASGSVSVKQDRVLLKDKDGNTAWKYSDGRIEEIK